MSKADALLKKATYFERLALYSDRKSFLQAMAQLEVPEVTITGDPNAENKRLAGQALQILQQLGITDDKTKALGGAVLFNRVDVAAMRREIQNAIYTGGISPLSHQNEINQLNQISSALKAVGAPGQADQAVGGPTGPVSKAPAAGGGRGGSISKEDQKAVFDFALQEGELSPTVKQEIDGILGPNTIQALEGVKNYFAKHYPQSYDPKKGGVRMTNQQAIRAAKTPAPRPQQ